jgi:hypothetical protein
MTTPKRWTELVRDARRHDISDWHPGGITDAVREADEAWTTQVETLNAELVKYVDISIALERDRDQCARERDAYKAERDALAARVAALEAALRPAWEAEAGATAGEWERVRDPYDDAPRVIADNCEIAVLTAQDGTAWLDAAFIAAAVNAARAAREVK